MLIILCWLLSVLLFHLLPLLFRPLLLYLVQCLLAEVLFPLHLVFHFLRYVWDEESD